MSRDEIRKRIAELEREGEKVKSMHFLSRIPLSYAKQRIIEINNEVASLLAKLPEGEKELHLIKKELRSLDFYG